MQVLDAEYVTVAQVATLLHVAPSTVRRWIRQGDVPAYRVGRRRVALKRTDLALLITPARVGGEKGAEPARGEGPEVHRLTFEEQRRGLATLERAELLGKRILERRGGKPFPPAWEALNELRDERTRQLT